MANSVHRDQTHSAVYTICLGLSVPILKVIMVRKDVHLNCYLAVYMHYCIYLQGGCLEPHYKPSPEGFLRVEGKLNFNAEPPWEPS